MYHNFCSHMPANDVTRGTKGPDTHANIHQHVYKKNWALTWNIIPFTYQFNNIHYNMAIRT